MRRHRAFASSCLLAVATTLAPWLAPRSAPALSISLSPVLPFVGPQLDIEILVDGFVSPGAPTLRSYDLDVSYDASLLAPAGVSFDVHLGTPGVDALTSSSAGGGVVDLASVSLLSGATLLSTQPDAFRLATLHFTIVDVGDAAFAFTQVLLGDLGGVPITPDAVNGATVPVPEASTAWLVLCGTAAFALARRRRARGAFAAVAIAMVCFAGTLVAARSARATCNLIPVATRVLPSDRGRVDRAIAAPGDRVAVRVDPFCEPGQPGFDPDPADNQVVLRFEPASGANSDVAVPAVSITLAECSVASCDVLLFLVPDTDADLLPAGDGNGLAGPARILIAKDGGATPVAEIATLFEPTRACDEEPERVFERFTVLPAANVFAALAPGSSLRATLDGGDNLLVPMDYDGALQAPPGSPIFSILEATAANVPAYSGGAPLRLPPDGAVRSFNQTGRPIPPLLRVNAAGDTLFGSADARRGVLRIQRRNPGFADFYDFTDRLLDDRGPVLLPIDAAAMRDAAPLPSLAAGSEAVVFARDEAAEATDANFDGDQTDLVPQILDPGTIASASTGAAVDDISTAGFNRPAIASAGAVAAFFESEARNGELDRNPRDVDAFDHVLRVYDAAGSERTLGQTILGDPTPAIDGKPIAVAGDLVFFRSRESDDAARQTRLAWPIPSNLSFAADPELSRTGRFLALETINPLDPVVADTNGNLDVYRVDRDTDEDGIFDEPGATSIALVSVATTGSAGAGISNDPAISADGRYVAFDSTSTNLIAGGTSAVGHIFVRDMQSGTTTLASTPNGVTQANGGSSRPSISDDGRYVAFDSSALNLGSGADGAIIVYDRLASAIDRRVTDAGGGDVAMISGDGTTIAICSTESFGQPNATADFEVWVVGPAGTRRMPTTDGLQPNRPSCFTGNYFLAISADGRYTAFQSNASNLVAGTTHDKANIFVYDYQADRLDLVSLSTDGTTSIENGQAQDVSISDDGRFVAFASSYDLTPADTGVLPLGHLYLYDRVTDTIERVDVDDAGTPSATEASAPAVCGDGRHVAFRTTADNLDGTANGYFARGLDQDTDDDDALDAGISLNAADGDALDTVLQVFDAQTSMLRPDARVPASVVALAAGRAAVLTPESDDGAGSGAKNGDADANDQIAQVYDGGTDTLLPLGIAAARVAISDQVVCMAVPEADQPDASNGDADSADHLLAYWRIGEPPASRVVTPYTVSTVQTFAVLAALGPYCVFGSAEPDSVGTLGLISNGDADNSDRVLGVLDSATGMLWSTTGPAAAEIVVGGSPVLAAFRTCEKSEGNVPLNGDGDPVGVGPGDCILRVLDVTGGTPVVVDTGRAAQPCTFPACNPFFEPYRVRGNTVSFLSLESDQSGPGPGTPLHCATTGVAGQCDFTGDGDAADATIQVFSVRAETVQSFPIVVTVPPAVPPFPDTSDDQTQLTIQLPETSVGEDVDEDGDIDGTPVVLILGDTDEDGALDDSGAGTGEADNCGEAVNPTQVDTDGDALGDVVCDANLFSFGPGQLVCDVDRNGQVDDRDVAAVFAARGTAVAGANDIRDANGSGTIDALDAGLCADLCTFADCRRNPPACGLGLEVLLLLAPLRAWRRRRPRKG